MDKQSKKIIVDNLKESFENSSGVIVTHFLGLNSSELTNLRSQVKDVGSKFCVAKNSLAKLAVKSTDYENLNDFFSGPTALVFSEDALAGIKVIKKFSDKNEKLKFITASLDKKTIEFKEFEKLAELPSLEEIRAKIVGYITAPHQQLVSVLNAPATETAGVIESYSKKK
ncbi:MAG: 50S ribosomal protein L10 [Cellvibrionales bacterium TMED122]|nr:MAG: 50S ribosomal protein L10 [Cellvibrionales bacterium TMED122]|tara:strand:+ start:850 stop:1359 length:510 start_codon:yes stop_codon:yes gene_type:complete